MKQILLTQGRVALVDDANYERLNKYKWHTKTYPHLFYAIRTIGTPVCRHNECMHRIILGLRPGDGLQCDHVDGDGLNNQRSNLRVCSRNENQYNRRKRSPGSSKYKGVRRDRRWWRVDIQVNKKSIYLGRFDSELMAALAYDEAAKKYFKGFALTNQMLGLL